MVEEKKERLVREDWLRGALELLATSGVEQIKVVPLAERLGVTTGSFYWHFKNRRALHEALLDYWELELTDAAITASEAYQGSAQERIWQLMKQVMNSGIARYDLAIWQWAQADAQANRVFTRAIEKRFKFTQWMFEEAGFDTSQAEARARILVVYMMGESTLMADTPEKRRQVLRHKYEILTQTL